MTDIGTRMKSYESNRRLAKGAVIIRVDGKAFHSWTDRIKANRPFDRAVIESMIYAMEQTVKEMQGFRLAYTQSDECTFLLTNLDEAQEMWFGGKQDKLISITASTFTIHFNDMIRGLKTEADYTKPALFDARAHNIPVEDAANNFFWRQQDWIRNSVHMLGRAHFSHKELYNKSVKDIKDMLGEKGIFWDRLFEDEKYGTFYNLEGFLPGKLTYEQINELAGIDVTKRD